MIRMEHIAIAQFNPTPGDVTANVQAMIEAIWQAREMGAKLVLFPEEAVSGYCIGDHNRNPVLVEGSLDALLRDVLPATRGIAVVAGLVAPDGSASLVDGSLAARNRYAVMEDGRLLALGAKTLMADDGVLSDSRYFLPQTPGAESPVTLKDGTRLGVLVCQDLWDDYSVFKPALHLRDQGAELLVVLNASPYYVGRRQDRIDVATRRVRETGLPLVYVNTMGVQDNGKNIILFDGGSFVLDGDGRMVAEMPQFWGGLGFASREGLGFASREGLCPTKPVGRSRVAALAGEARCARGGCGFAAGAVGRVAELQAALEFGLDGFFRRVGAGGAVIGLSGGIDSAVSAVLLTSVLGADRVLALNMPSRFSSQTTQDAARELALHLGIEYIVHPIESVAAAKKVEYEGISGQSMKTLTFENIQARERGNLLMTWAQERGFLVVGNGNKTEFQRGYATLYGDLIGAIMPLGDVPKTDVYRLAHRFNELRPGLIPQAIVDIPPSAELSDAQDVNRGLGDPFDYDVEAPMGVELVEYAMTPGELRRLFEARKLNPGVWAPVRGSLEVYDKMDAAAFEALAWEVFRAIEATVFKRVQSPPILKVSRKAFGCDLRESMFVRLHV